MSNELTPRNGETIIVRADGERRIVPKGFLKNRAVMNEHGWREEVKKPMAPPKKEESFDKETMDTKNDPFKTETKTGPGRPKSKTN